VSASELTSVGALVVSVIAAVVLPIVFRRQAAKQVKALEERERVKADAVRDAALAADEAVSWEKINRALAATIAEERAANREKLAELRETFTAENERSKRLTDNDLDRAKAEIARLAAHIRELEDRIADQARKLEEIAKQPQAGS
jgi:type II secretory pathway pseudopilin PulG